MLYPTLAAVSIGGLICPLLFPIPPIAKTAGYVISLSSAVSLAVGHQTGSWARVSEWEAKQRDSRNRIREEKLISRELREQKRLEFEDLKEVLIMLDDLTPHEQRHFLNELGMPDLIELYQPLPQVLAPQTVEAVATPVKDEPNPFEGVGTLNWAVENVIAQATQPTATEGIVDDTFEEIDLGKSIAEMMTVGEVPLCVMLACPPRTGKTTLVTTTIAWLHRLTQGHANVKIYNGKENLDPITGELKDKFLGLVDDPTRYMPVETNEAGKQFAEEFRDKAADMLKPRQYPDVMILDEYNNIRGRVNGYDQQNGLPKTKSYLNQVNVDADRFVTQGTSRKQFLLITSHSAYVKNIGIDRSIQDGIYSIVLGRGGKLDGVYKALKGANAVVQNAVRANQLLLELQQWEQSPIRDSSKVIALTNLFNGTFDLYFVKHIDLERVGFAPVQPPEPAAEDDPYEMWDEVYEDGEGHQPEDDPDWGKTATLSSQKPRQPSQQELIEALAAWIKGLSSPPTDENLRLKAAQLAHADKSVISDKALTGIKWILAQNHGIKFD